MGSAIGRTTCWKEAFNSGQIISRGDQSQLRVFTAHLRMSNRCYQRVAKAFLPGRILQPAALCYVYRFRLPRTAIINFTLGSSVGLAEVAKIADARPSH